MHPLLKSRHTSYLYSISIFSSPPPRWIDSRVAIQFFYLQAFDLRHPRPTADIYRNLSKCFHRIKRVVSFRLFSRRKPFSPFLYRASISIRFDRSHREWDEIANFSRGLFRGTTRIVTRLKPRKNLLFKGRLMRSRWTRSAAGGSRIKSVLHTALRRMHFVIVRSSWGFSLCTRFPFIVIIPMELFTVSHPANAANNACITNIFAYNEYTNCFENIYIYMLHTFCNII